jgi:hypothetical protein
MIEKNIRKFNLIFSFILLLLLPKASYLYFKYLLNFGKKNRQTNLT